MIKQTEAQFGGLRAQQVLADSSYNRNAKLVNKGFQPPHWNNRQSLDSARAVKVGGHSSDTAQADLANSIIRFAHRWRDHQQLPTRGRRWPRAFRRRTCSSSRAIWTKMQIDTNVLVPPTWACSKAVSRCALWSMPFRNAILKARCGNSSAANVQQSVVTCNVVIDVDNRTSC